MALKRVRADQIKVGDVLPASPLMGRGPMSIKEVNLITNPVTRRREIKIRGTLGIIEKYHADEFLSVYDVR